MSTPLNHAHYFTRTPQDANNDTTNFYENYFLWSSPPQPLTGRGRLRPLHEPGAVGAFFLFLPTTLYYNIRHLEETCCDLVLCKSNWTKKLKHIQTVGWCNVEICSRLWIIEEEMKFSTTGGRGAEARRQQMMLRGETASPKRTLPVADVSPQSCISGPHRASPHRQWSPYPATNAE